MGDILANANWLAVIVSLVVGMAMGFVWYNPKFPIGKIWAEGTGVGDAPEGPMAVPMGLNTLGLLLLAIFVGATSGAKALGLLGLAAFGVLQTSGNMFAGKPISVGLIHIGYWLVCFILMGLVHSFLG